jgi:asparagine synthetase B (glutamine-hydrolysing)
MTATPSSSSTARSITTSNFVPNWRNPGTPFHSHCDTETVLHAFLEWDTDCFQKLRGMFAIALWTNSAKRLVLARDRVGIKPLYIAREWRRAVLRLRAEGDPDSSRD